MTIKQKHSNKVKLHRNASCYCVLVIFQRHSYLHYDGNKVVLTQMMCNYNRKNAFRRRHFILLLYFDCILYMRKRHSIKRLYDSKVTSVHFFQYFGSLWFCSLPLGLPFCLCVFMLALLLLYLCYARVAKRKICIVVVKCWLRFGFMSTGVGKIFLKRNNNINSNNRTEPYTSEVFLLQLFYLLNIRIRILCAIWKSCVGIYFVSLLF